MTPLLARNVVCHHRHDDERRAILSHVGVVDTSGHSNKKAGSGSDQSSLFRSTKSEIVTLSAPATKNGRSEYFQMVDEESKIRSRYERAGQGHVLKHLSELPDSEKDELLKQLDSIVVEDLSALLESALSEQQALESSSLSATIQPFSNAVGQSTDKEEMEKAAALGLQAIGRGQVAALVLSGGQGTRLGFSGPKGMYNIGLPSGKSLFQLLAERIQKLACLGVAVGEAREAPATIPFYIMTSPDNHDETVAYFQEHSFLGLSKDTVRFFPQGMLPCLTEDGKIIMETASKVAMAPDGNGGIYPSLVSSGMLDDMQHRGVQFLHVFSIDNALTRPADPVFMGYCISKGADCGNKVVWKSHAHEKVGVIAEKEGKPCVVEYSDISTEMAEAVDGNGRLVFGAGNICNHFYTLDFVRNVIVPRLGKMYHVARKKIPYYDEDTQQTTTPASNNGIKLESFIFDVFPLSSTMAVLDVVREQEFAPVKNAPGSATDSPDTARELLSNSCKSWVVHHGGTLVGDLESICEISPLTSYAGEGLDMLAKEKEITCPFSI